MNRNVRTTSVVAVQGAWVLVLEQQPWQHWFTRQTVQLSMDVLGHPCCGRGLGCFPPVRGAFSRLVNQVGWWADKRTYTLSAFQLSEEQAHEIAPDLVWHLLDEDPGCDHCAPRRPASPWKDLTDPTREDVDRAVVARWMAEATDVDMSDLVARAVAGEQYDIYACVWCFDRPGWSSVGVDSMAEAILWMAEGCGSPGEVQRAKDAGYLSSWALRVVRESAERRRADTDLDSL